MKNLIRVTVFLFIVVAGVFCYRECASGSSLETVIKRNIYPKEKVIYLTSMGKVSKKDRQMVQGSIERFFDVPVKYIGMNELPQSAYCTVRGRYKGTKLLDHLKTLPLDDTYDYKVVALTDRDIETKRFGNEHWGIIGIAYLGHDQCVVSTHRIKSKNYEARLVKASLHEVGHTLNIDHCKFGVKECFMQDAKGTAATIDRAKIYLCDGCKKKMRF